jgi:hypothetical protein
LIRGKNIYCTVLDSGGVLLPSKERLRAPVALEALCYTGRKESGDEPQENRENLA